jgi:hypothetical protein
MPLLKHIENLRAAPDATKRRVSLLYASIGTAVIALVWIVNLGVSWSNLGKEEVVAKTEKSPVGLMTEAIKENFGRVKSGVSQLGSVIEAVQSNFQTQ